LLNSAVVFVEKAGKEKTKTGMARNHRGISRQEQEAGVTRHTWK
jgi:hypothetical protein